MFEINAAGRIGNDRLNVPYDITQNAERWYLQCFAKMEGDKSSSNISSMDEGGDEFKVERIHSRKEIFIDGNGIDGAEGRIECLYLVEWDGYGWSECTWEPERNINKCTEALREFEEQLKTEHRDCVHNACLCEIGGYRVFTKPCMRHHYERREYQEIFKKYQQKHRNAQSIVRQLANIKISETVIGQLPHQRKLK